MGNVSQKGRRSSDRAEDSCFRQAEFKWEIHASATSSLTGMACRSNVVVKPAGNGCNSRNFR
jgi:hypothetical protein